MRFAGSLLSRRAFAVAFCLTVFAIQSFAAPKSGSASAAMSSYPASISGDYVVYRDYTWKAPTWIGFLRYDDSTWGAFVITPSSGTNVSILFRSERVDGAMVLTGQNIISKITNADVGAVNYLMQLLPDLSSWRLAAAKDGNTVVATKEAPRSELLPPAVSLSLTRAEFGGDITLTFAPEIPVFNLQSMAGSGGKAMLSLERYGRIQTGGDAAFFGFAPRPAAKSGPALAVPASRKTEARTVDGVTLSLDGQWTMIADNTFFLGNSAVIIVDTLDLALMQVPRENLSLSLVRLFSLSSGTAWSDPSALAVSGTAKRFRVENTFYDMESGTVNRDIKLCVPSSDGKKCTVVSLSVNETAYRANKAYFDSLF